MKHKWTLIHVSPGDYKGLEGYLNRQADKGWELEKVGALFARWKRTERPSRWCVDLMGARKEREEKREYLELCAEGGWEIFTMQGSVCIFRARAGTAPAPVQTDPELEKKNYKKYYLRPAILGVVWLLALIAMYTLMGLSFSTRFGSVAIDLRYGWMEHWMVLAIYLGLPVWGLLAVWKIFHFVSSQIRNRERGVQPPPTWAMWLNSILTSVSLFMGVLVIVGFGLDKVLIGLAGTASFYVVLSVIVISSLYQWLMIDKELFKGEKRRILVTAGAFLVSLVVFIAADILAPYGEWSTNWWSSNGDKAVVKYEESFANPIVHSKDMGLSEGRYVDVEHKITPMGEYWKLGYTYDEGEVGYLIRGQFSESVTAPSRWQASLLADGLADGYGVEKKYAPWPEEGLTPLELDWADEAWQGRMTLERGEEITFLVVRRGRQVARLVFPTDLLTPEHLAVIQSELTE